MSAYDLPIIGKKIKKFDESVCKNGLQSAMENFLDECKTHVKVIKDQSVREVLFNKPVIIVSNHPAEADVPVLLSSLENRKDLHLVINSGFLNLCPNFDKFLIPVYINNRLFSKPGPKIRLKLFKKLSKFTVLSKEEEHKKNIVSIKLAGQIVERGAAVVIFPGGGGVKGKWFSGIGHMIKDIKNKNDAYIVNAYIEGTSDLDYLRLIPGLRYLMPKIKVTLSSPELLTQFNSVEAKIIANNLEEKYNQWVNTIKSENKNVILPYRSLLVLRSLFFWLTARINQF